MCYFLNTAESNSEGGPGLSRVAFLFELGQAL